MVSYLGTCKVLSPNSGAYFTLETMVSAAHCLNLFVGKSVFSFTEEET